MWEGGHIGTYFRCSLLVQQCYPKYQYALHDFLVDLQQLYHRQLFLGAYRIAHHPALAEEAVRRSLIHIARYPRIQENILYKQGKERENYLAIIANSRAWDVRREERRQPSWSPLDQELAAPLHLDDVVAMSERLSTVTQLLLQSENTNIQALRLLGEGLNYLEIADELSISEVNVRQRVHRGRKELISFLKGEGEDE